MALPGMKSTADFAADERPKDWRTSILLNTPRNGASLFALTSAMRSEKATDPEFFWWEEDVQLFNYAITADIDNAVTTIPLASGGIKLKAGDMLKANATGEAMRVITVVSDTSITVTRAVGPGGSAAGTAAALDFETDPKLLYVGSAYREGAPRSIGVSHNPVKVTNLTQIFRDPIEMTRTAQQTNYRTGDAWANDKRRALNKHSLGIERAFWLGTKYETLEAGQPLRFTGGITSFVPADNIKTVTALGVDMDELESYFPGIFAFGSSEKVAWGSIKTMMLINQIVRKNSAYQWGPNEKEYGMNVRRLFSPAGTLTFMEHPLFGQAGQFLAEDLFIMDSAHLKYRYMQDTVLLKDRQDPGTDGKTDEYLTEAGLEVGHGKYMYWLKGFKVAKADD